VLLTDRLQHLKTRRGRFFVGVEMPRYASPKPQEGGAQGGTAALRGSTLGIDRSKVIAGRSTDIQARYVYALDWQTT
jgi:hypothetical protein